LSADHELVFVIGPFLGPNRSRLRGNGGQKRRP